MSRVRVLPPLLSAGNHGRRTDVLLLFAAMGKARLPRGNCLHCGAELDRRVKRYCNLRCQQDYARREYIEAWFDGRVSGARTLAYVSGYVRHYLFEKYRGCVICGWAERNPVTGRVP